MEFELRAGGARVAIDPQAGGRLSSLEVDGLELLVPRSSEPLVWGLYPMAPWAGRVHLGRVQRADFTMRRVHLGPSSTWAELPWAEFAGSSPLGRVPTGPSYALLYLDLCTLGPLYPYTLKCVKNTKRLITQDPGGPQP